MFLDGFIEAQRKNFETKNGERDYMMSERINVKNVRLNRPRIWKSNTNTEIENEK